MSFVSNSPVAHVVAQESSSTKPVYPYPASLNTAWTAPWDKQWSTSVYTPTSTPSEAPSSAPVDAPMNTPSDTPTSTQSQNLFGTPSETPAGTSAAPIATGSATYSGPDFQESILNSTNFYRSQHQAVPMVWNSTIAEFAQGWANSCVWQHSQGPYGENLAEGYFSTTSAIDAWADEEKDYKYAAGQYGDNTGHFTQLVWKQTTSVGCAAVNCNDANGGAIGWFLVCEYYPRGNVIGDFVPNVVPSGASSEKRGLAARGGAESVSSGRKKRIIAVIAAYVMLVMMT